MIIILLLHLSCNLFNITNSVEERLNSRLDSLFISKASVTTFDNKNVTNTYTYGGANEETIFKLASLTKIITGIAVMQLYENNLLDLNEDINTYLPFEVKNPYYENKPITVNMLLTHTSSIQDNWDVIYGNYRSYNLTENPLPSLKSTCQEYLSATGKYYSKDSNYYNFKPGSTLEYSNMGFTLLGLIVETISKKDFKEYCNENIFTPFGMNGGWNLFPETTNNMAESTNINNDVVTTYADALSPAGFYSCSSKDFATLMSAFFGNRILSEDSTTLMLKTQTGDQAMVFKYSNFKVNNEKLVFHLGGLDGTRTSIFYSKDKGKGFVLLSSGEYDTPLAFYEVVKLLITDGGEK